MKQSFIESEKERQIEWRQSNISTDEQGFQNGNRYRHVVPSKLWEETLYEEIKKELSNYLYENKIHPHSGKHNLLSSWVQCANLYFVVRVNSVFKELMLGFLRSYVSDNITKINNVELEFAFKDRLSPDKLLGESGGNRGSGQTSPDIAFEVEVTGGEGIILTENKYTEHSFYSCSARTKKEGSKLRKANPDPIRCMKRAEGNNYKSVCHQYFWGRKYLDYISFVDKSQLDMIRCPASTAGYQLLRQQALAEGVVEKGDYDTVISSVAYDERNKTLVHCLKSSGIPDFTKDWESIIEGKVLFKTWTHQQWVNYVRGNGDKKDVSHWVEYVRKRYNY